MKSKKWLLTAGVVLSTTALLAACGKADKEADAPTTFHMSMQQIRHLWIIVQRLVHRQQMSSGTWLMA